MTARILSRYSAESIDRALGTLVLGFAAFGLLAFVLFMLASLIIGATRLVTWVWGM